MAELLLDLLERLRAAEPGRVAVELLRARASGGFDADPITREQWLRAAARVAGGLLARGVKPGDRVLLCLGTSREFLEVFLGVMWMGALPVPLPSLEGFARTQPFRDRIRSVMTSARPALAVADPRTAKALLDDAFAAVVTAPELAGEPAPRFAADPGAPAFLQYTSGSTGEPRGVIVTHGNLAANVKALAGALALTPADHQVTWLPLYHDMGLVGGLLTTASHGVITSLLSPVEFLLRPAIWLQAASERRATLTVAPNFAYSLLARKVPDVDLAGIDLSPLRAAVNGAEPVDPATAHAFAARFAAHGFRATAHLPVYGLAEATLAVTVPPLGRAWVVDEIDRDAAATASREAIPSSHGARFVSTGRALAGHAVAILGPAGEELPERRLGEIVVRGPSVSPGYFGEPPAPTPGEVRTGDLGYVADGELFVVDRLKDLILVAGRSYSPADVEHAAEEVELVRRGRVVAFSVPDAEAGTEVMVIVAEVRGAAADGLEQRIAAAVTERIGLAPKRVLLVDRGALARTSSGKIMRRDARKRYLARELRATSRWRQLWTSVRARVHGR